MVITVIYVPRVLDQEIEGEYIDLKQPLKIPGCKALRPDDVMDPMMDQSNQQYHEYLKLAMEYTCFDGILINTWEDLEGETIKALRSNEKLQSVPSCPIYPIGPWRRTVNITEHNEVIQWLDKQNQKLILYVSLKVVEPFHLKK
ncbi:hypothetical protein RDI58_004386 [Solanum bulbocastanum]|uniref:Uncharacterized protein n=1 Tax=Solanum bulbocastanum TaxID=147425 RepID=A0AAN8TYZ7_SOLBU